MKSSWRSRFAENVRDFEGYPIGKTLQYLTDPEIISLAGGLPSPDVFQRTELRLATEKAFDREIDRIMQQKPIRSASKRKGIRRDRDRALFCGWGCNSAKQQRS